jgi:hypothetical protein
VTARAARLVRRLFRRRHQMRSIDEGLSALETWLRAGDPLADAPDVEMGCWATPEQAEELDLLAAELWPRNEYFAIVAEHERRPS